MKARRARAPRLAAWLLGAAALAWAGWGRAAEEFQPVVPGAQPAIPAASAPAGRAPGVPAAAVAAGAGVQASASEPGEPRASQVEVIHVAVGQSKTLKAPWLVRRVSVADPEIADVQALSADQVLIIGNAIGTTDVIIWSEEEEAWQARVYVELDIERLKEDLRRLFPEARLDLNQSQGSGTRGLFVLTGTFGREEQAEHARRFLDASGLNYVDMTGVAGLQQVQIQVRLAEVSRRAIRELGINAVRTGQDFFGGSLVGTSGGGAINPIEIGPPEGALAAPNLPFVFNEEVGVSPLVTLLAGFPRADLELFIQALAENQYLRVLAEPNLVALSGEEATFLAGGEFPVPVVQGTSAGAGTTITVIYKEFGVLLKFQPYVLGDGAIRLTVAPEVSDLSDVGAVQIEGFRIPSVLTRRAATTLEMKSGQTFAMAGLLNRTTTARNSRVPYLGDLPVLGTLFRSIRYERGETELVVLVTASLVEPISVPDLTPTLDEDHSPPSDWELYVLGLLEERSPEEKTRAAQTAWYRKMNLDGLRMPSLWAGGAEEGETSGATPQARVEPGAAAPAPAAAPRAPGRTAGSGPTLPGSM